MWKNLKVSQSHGLICSTLLMLSFCDDELILAFLCSDGAEINGQGVVSQRHHSNWVDDEDDDEGEDSEPYVQATPPYCEE